jgi:hypothetical protein
MYINKGSLIVFYVLFVMLRYPKPWWPPSHYWKALNEEGCTKVVWQHLDLQARVIEY